MVGPFRIRLMDTATGPIVPGTVGNLGLEIKNSQEVLVSLLDFETARTGGARFTDSSNITADVLLSGTYETGNYLDVVRVDNLDFVGFPDMGGLLIEDSTNLLFSGTDREAVADAFLDTPTGGEQTVNVLITGDSSGVVFRDFNFGEGPEPRMLVESTAPVTLEEVDEYAAVSGDCIVQVPEGSTDDSLIQAGSEQTLVRSGNCWVLP